MADTTQYYTIVTQQGELAIAGNNAYIVDKFIPVYDFRLDNSIDSRFLRTARQEGIEDIVTYMLDKWGEVYKDSSGTNIPLSYSDVFLWNTDSTDIDWTYGVASSFIGENQGGFSIGDIEVLDSLGAVLQPATSIGTPTNNLDNLAQYSLGDVIYNTSSPSLPGAEEDYKFFNGNIYIANSSNPEETSVKVVSDNGIFPDDDAYLFSDGGYIQPSTTIDTASYFDAVTGDYNLSQDQANSICFSNVESYQTVFTDETTGTQVPGFKFNIKFSQDVGTIKFNKMILFGINTQFNPDTGTCEKVGDYFPFAITVIPVTQLKTNVVGHGIEEFNLNAQIVVTRTGYSNNKLILDNCCWTKLDKYQNIGGVGNDACVSTLPNCGPNSATLAWDRNVYIGTRSADIFINNESEISKLLIADGGDWITYQQTPGDDNTIVDLQKPQFGLGNKNLGDSLVDNNRSYWLWSFIGESDADDSHDLILTPKNTQEEFLSQYTFDYELDGSPKGLNGTDPQVFQDHPVYQVIAPNTTWSLIGTDQSAVNVNKLFPAISFGKEGKIFNEYYGSSVRLNQLRSLPTSDFTANNIFVHNLPVDSTGWPTTTGSFPGADKLPAYETNDIVVRAKNNLVLSSSSEVIIPNPNKLSVVTIKDVSNIIANSTLNDTTDNDFGISLGTVTTIVGSSLSESSSTDLRLKSVEKQDGTNIDYLSELNLRIQMLVDSTTGSIDNGVLIDVEERNNIGFSDEPYINIHSLNHLYSYDRTGYFGSEPSGIEFMESETTYASKTNTDSSINLFTKSRYKISGFSASDLTLGVSLIPDTFYDGSSTITPSTEINIQPSYDTTKINIVDAGAIKFKDGGLFEAYSDNVSLSLVEEVIHSDGTVGYETDARRYKARISMYSFVDEAGTVISDENVGIEFKPTGYYDSTEPPTTSQVFLFDEVDIAPASGTDNINIIDVKNIKSDNDISIIANDYSEIVLEEGDISSSGDNRVRYYNTRIKSTAIWQQDTGGIFTNWTDTETITPGIVLSGNMELVGGSSIVDFTNEFNISPDDTTDAINLNKVHNITNWTNENSSIVLTNQEVYSSGNDILMNNIIELVTYSSFSENGTVTSETTPGIIFSPTSVYLPIVGETLSNFVTIAPKSGTEGINITGINTLGFISDFNVSSPLGVSISSYGDKGTLSLTETTLFSDTDTDLKTYDAVFNLKSVWDEDGTVTEEEVGLKITPRATKVSGVTPGVIQYDEINITTAGSTSKINIQDIGTISGNNVEVIASDSNDNISANSVILTSTSTYTKFGLLLSNNTVGLEITNDVTPITVGTIITPSFNNNVILRPDSDTTGIIINKARINGDNGYITANGGDNNYGLEIINNSTNFVTDDILIKSDNGSIDIDGNSLDILSRGTDNGDGIFIGSGGKTRTDYPGGAITNDIIAISDGAIWLDATGGPAILTSDISFSKVAGQSVIIDVNDNTGTFEINIAINNGGFRTYRAEEAAGTLVFNQVP
jgi:hypothetical protein